MISTTILTLMFLGSLYVNVVAFYRRGGWIKRIHNNGIHRLKSLDFLNPKTCAFVLFVIGEIFFLIGLFSSIIFTLIVYIIITVASIVSLLTDDEFKLT